MKPQKLIIFFSGFVALLLGSYITFSESEEISVSPKINQKNQVTPMNNKIINIGKLRFLLPESWKQENPSNSMRLAQFLLPGKDKNTRLVVFAGIGGTLKDNLDRWYKQFETENVEGKPNKPIEWTEKINNFDITFTYLEGTFLKSNMTMTGPVERMNNYALLAAIVNASSERYYFKITGSLEVLSKQKENFNMFIRSIDSI